MPTLVALRNAQRARLALPPLTLKPHLPASVCPASRDPTLPLKASSFAVSTAQRATWAAPAAAPAWRRPAAHADLAATPPSLAAQNARSARQDVMPPSPTPPAAPCAPLAPPLPSWARPLNLRAARVRQAATPWQRVAQPASRALPGAPALRAAPATPPSAQPACQGDTRPCLAPLSAPLRPLAPTLPLAPLPPRPAPWAGTARRRAPPLPTNVRPVQQACTLPARAPRRPRSAWPLPSAAARARSWRQWAPLAAPAPAPCACP